MIYLEAERMDKLVMQEKCVPYESEIVKRWTRYVWISHFQSYWIRCEAAYGNQYFGRLPIGDLNELQSIKMQVKSILSDLVCTE